MPANFLIYALFINYRPKSLLLAIGNACGLVIIFYC